jgi:hypothetical protein
MEYKAKYEVARALGAINWHLREQGKNLILFAPGRICTSSPELGVPCSFAEISEFNAICEISETGAGYMPELSYGSHIFQDLVEADILYVAVFEDKRRIHFHPEKLMEMENGILEIVPDADSSIIAWYDLAGSHARLIHDMHAEHLLLSL